MKDSESMENQIQEEVERLREQCRDTRELYREVCALLFFRYGITPTTNKLYQFVRKGSMSVPTEVLSNFWKELREKSKIRIEQPDLPEDLNNLAGELMTTIWSKAQIAAHESLTALRSEVEAKVTELQAERDTIASNRDVVVLKLRNTEEKLTDQFHRAKELEQLLLSSERQRRSLEHQLSQSKTDLEEIRQAMENNRKHLEAEVARLHESIDDIHELSKKELSQAMREINREQSRVTELETALATARDACSNLQYQHKIETNSLKNQIGDLREKAGELNGKLQLLKSNNEQLNAQIATKEEKLKEILASAEAKNWSDKIQQRKNRRFMLPNKK